MAVDRIDCRCHPVTVVVDAAAGPAIFNEGRDARKPRREEGVMPMIAGTRRTFQRFRRHGGVRLVLLVGVLSALFLCVAARDLTRGFRVAPTDQRLNDWPTVEDVRSYLDRRSAEGIQVVTGPNQPSVTMKGRIESLRIKREDTYFTSARFILRTDGGPYAIDAMIHHHPTDGVDMFDGVTVYSTTKL
jgi:hypothetical protein